MPGWKLGAPLLLFFLAFGIDGSNSYLYLLKQSSGDALANIPNLYIPNNTLRLFTGSGMGIALASILYPAFNQSAWKDASEERALDWKNFSAWSASSCQDWPFHEAHCSLPDRDPERPGRAGLTDHGL
jgi:hypothetical protein